MKEHGPKELALALHSKLKSTAEEFLGGDHFCVVTETRKTYPDGVPKGFEPDLYVVGIFPEKRSGNDTEATRAATLLARTRANKRFPGRKMRATPHQHGLYIKIVDPKPFDSGVYVSSSALSGFFVRPVAWD